LIYIFKEPINKKKGNQTIKNIAHTKIKYFANFSKSFGIRWIEHSTVVLFNPFGIRCNKANETMHQEQKQKKQQLWPIFEIANHG